MSSSERSSVLNLAIARLRKLFPTSSIVRELDKLKPPPIAKAAIENVSVRCMEKGCPWPAVAGKQRCRQHLIDLVSERSLLPSCAGEMAYQPQPHAHA